MQSELSSWKKEVNSKWFNQMKNYLADGGTWIWPDTGFKYRLQEGKFIGESEEANEALRSILPVNDPLIPHKNK